MYPLAPFILQNFKAILWANPELWGCTIFRSKMAHLSWTKFFWHKPFTFIYLLALFIVQNLKKFLLRIQSCEDAQFLGPNWLVYLPPKRFFFCKIINIILIYLLAPFIVKYFFKNLPCGSRVMRMLNFWAQNGPIPQMRIFSENLLMSILSFIHVYLHAKNQSQISIY